MKNENREINFDELDKIAGGTEETGSVTTTITETPSGSPPEKPVNIPNKSYTPPPVSK